MVPHSVVKPSQASGLEMKDPPPFCVEMKGLLPFSNHVALSACQLLFPPSVNRSQVSCFEMNDPLPPFSIQYALSACQLL